MGGRIVYYLHTAVAGMARARQLTASATLTLASALLVMGALGMALQGARGLAQTWGRGGHMNVALADSLPAESWPGVVALLAALPGTAAAELVPPQEALRRFRARGPAAQALVEGVDALALPATVALTPQASMVDGAALGALAGRIEAVPGVVDVVYGEIQLARVRATIRVLALVAIALGGLFALAMVCMVTNTIRLMIYARQDEVRILTLVGATAWFVRLPFLIEGLAWGLMAGGLGGAGLWGIERLAREPLLQAEQILGAGVPLRLYSPAMLAAQLGAGALLGLVGSALALHRYLDADLR